MRELVHDIKEAMRKHRSAITDAIMDLFGDMRNRMNAGQVPIWEVLFSRNQSELEMESFFRENVI